MSDFSSNASDQKQSKPDVVLSPCISVCALDEDDVCIGCFRSAKEIGEWGRVDNNGKREILKNVARRMAES